MYYIYFIICMLLGPICISYQNEYKLTLVLIIISIVIECIHYYVIIKHNSSPMNHGS